MGFKLVKENRPAIVVAQQQFIGNLDPLCQICKDSATDFTLLTGTPFLTAQFLQAEFKLTGSAAVSNDARGVNNQQAEQKEAQEGEDRVEATVVDISACGKIQ
jgi:hypothetical protein